VDPHPILVGAQDAMTSRRVFGDPIQVEGATILPVAAIAGGGGGGGGTKTAGVEGSGVGFGLAAQPAGVFVIRDGDAKWRPALNLNRVILGGQLVGIVAILTIGALVRRWLAHA
jgi:uncharacterized spore protein YtfJ